MDEVSLNSEPVYDDEADEFEIEGDYGMAESIAHSGIIQGENPIPPAVGMEFESYEDVYYFYNCYAKDHGFGVRVSNTWYRKSRERYRGKLSCSSAGFKKKSEANRPRPETRTGCPAMVKFRLMENRRWRIIEVELEHNHLTNRASGKFYKSHKNVGLGTKRSLPVEVAEEVQKVRLFRTVIVETEDSKNVYVDDDEFGKNIDQSNQLKLKQGDAHAIYSFFCNFQLKSPSFFYVMDINEKGYIRNLFWTDTRCRPAYGYFGDIVVIDTTCLSEKYEVPLVVFTGVNHHRQPVLLGCGLLSCETIESFTWLFRAWLSFMLGRPPQVIFTGQCKNLQASLYDVFPRASHCLCLSDIMKRVPEKFGDLHGYEAIKVALTKAACDSLKVDEFEAAWEDMIQRYGTRDNKWLQALYEDRKKWAPVYLKETFLAGIFPDRPSAGWSSFFEGILQKHTTLREFLSNYDQAVQRIYQEEALADLESKTSSPALKSRIYFELQISKLYTNNIFKKFQREVERMFSCFCPRQVSIDGSIITYIVNEHAEVAENRTEIREYEVMYNPCEGEVVCVCGLFNFEGYLCRHALSILNHNCVEEIPHHYILSRWRKDIHRSYVFDHGCKGIDINNPVHRYDSLYKTGVQVVEEARKPQDCCKFALQALDEMLNKVRLTEEDCNL